MTTVVAPVAGYTVPLKEIPDPVFSQEIMGPGIAVIPSDGRVVCPVDGQVAKKMPHALIFDTECGGVLLHLGIDTVDLPGSCFELQVPADKTVTKGLELGIWHPDRVREAQCYPAVIIVCLENPCRPLCEGPVKLHQPLLEFC